MKRTRLLAATLLALLACQPVFAQDIVAYRNTDGVNRTDVSVANPLPVTNAAGATAAAQATANASLASIDTKTIASAVSSVNSSATPLGISGVFTGTGVDVTAYASATVTVFADQASAANGLSIQQSINGTNWDITDTYTVSASSSKNIAVPIFGQYLRVVYTNGGVAQGALRLQTILHARQPWGSSVKPIDGLSSENDMQTVIATNLLKNSASSATLDMQRSITAVDGIGTGVAAVAPASCSAAVCGQVPTVLSNTSAPAVVKASAGNLYSVSVTLLAGQGPGFVMVSNTATVPADGAVTPLVCRYLPAGPGSWSFDLTTAGIPKRFGTGIASYFSSDANCRTKTAATFEQMEVTFQ